MSQLKNYYLTILEHCSDEQFGQQAVEHALLNGDVKLTYDLEADLRYIMGEPGQPETGRYDELCATWRAHVRAHTETLTGLYETSGLMAEIMGVRLVHIGLLHSFGTCQI